MPSVLLKLTAVGKEEVGEALEERGGYGSAYGSDYRIV
jgi:hypothetical protein